MEQIFELIQLALSIGLLSSVLAIPFIGFSTRAIRWSHKISAAGSNLFESARRPQLDEVQRWIVRIARRKEAPDEDANGLIPTLKLQLSTREDDREPIIEAPEVGEIHSRLFVRSYSDHFV